VIGSACNAAPTTYFVIIGLMQTYLSSAACASIKASQNPSEKRRKYKAKGNTNNTIHG
jgi:hypothetical protein